MTGSDNSQVFTQSHESFEEAFPQIEQIEVDIKETDMVETQRVHHYTKDDIPGKVSCTNHQCTNKGIRLDFLIAKMKRDGESHAEFTESCTGVEKMGQSDHKSCPHMFHVGIDIEYKN